MNVWDIVSKKKKSDSSTAFEKKACPAPLVTVVTVCRNSASVIEKTIDSVLGQTYPKIEYLVVDGASEDATADAAERYMKQFRAKGFRYQVLSEKDKGIYDAMNKGIRRASGEVIGFINAGDWYEPGAVAVAAKEYCRTHYDYFLADVNLIRANGKMFVKHSKTDRFPTSRHWNHPASFAAKRLYEELGGFQCRGIHDDFEFFLRTRKSGKRIVIKNEILANFSIGGISNERSLRMCSIRIKDRYQAYVQNGYSPFCFWECVGMEIIKYMIR